MKKLIQILIEQYGGKGKYEVPSDHHAALQVPKGGSCCKNCKYWNEKEEACGNSYYKQWAGTEEIPVSPDEFCSDWWEPIKQEP